MREIKFRGKDILGRWHYGHLTVVNETLVSGIKPGTYISNSAGSPFAYEVRPDTVGQFTGFFDKNKKEIYEGDTVRWEDKRMKSLLVIGKVIWKKDGWGVEGFWDSSQDEPDRAFSEYKEFEIVIV